MSTTKSSLNQQRPTLSKSRKGSAHATGQQGGVSRSFTPPPTQPMKLCSVELTSHEKYIVFHMLQKLGAARTPNEERLMEKMR